MTETRARVTFDLDYDADGNPGELCIWMNPEGRDKLVKLLQELTPQWEHSHLLARSWGLSELALDEVAYRDGAKVLGAVKVQLRLDEWDAQFAPHVLTGRPDTD